MNFISVRDLKLRPGQVWETLARSGEVVITANGKPIGILTGTTPETLDETLAAIRQARAQGALSRIRRQAALSGSAALSDDVISREISAVRRSQQRP